MMKNLFALSAALGLLIAGGCATTGPTWQEQLKGYPLIELGQKPPTDGNYVVHIPAGRPVPMYLNLKGDLFEKDTSQEVTANPRKDIYLYQDWMSFDMKTWTKRRATLDFKWDVGIPSYKSPKPGHITIIVNRKD